MDGISNIKIPSYENYSNYNFKKCTIPQLKIIAKHYKLRLGGKKNDITSRIVMHLKQSKYIINIQRRCRGQLQRKYNKLHGPAFKDRSLCTNDTDFYTLDSLNTIPYNQFYSFKDDDNFIYGFEISSIYNIILKNNLACENPYNRKPFPENVIHDIRNLIRLSNVMKIPVNAYIKTSSTSNKFEQRALSLFQEIDNLGNYSDHKWFTELSALQMSKFVRDLCDIWQYRAQITPESKLAICPPTGDPFIGTNIVNIHTFRPNMIKEFALSCIERLVKRGTSTEYKSLGAIYVLTALTLVSNSAATSLPWLYQSVA